MLSISTLGKFLMDVELFPLFFYVHFIISCIIVREDSKDIGSFRQKHPLTSWICSLVAAFSGAFIASFLFSDPLIDILQENMLMVVFTIVWYLLNYCPGDFLFKISMSPVFMFPASVLHEIFRLKFVYLGLFEAAKLYPKAPIIIILGGIIKGNGYGFIKLIERLIRGKWDPKSNELLVISYFTKSAVIACTLFLLHHMKLINIPIEVLYFIIFVGFTIGRLVFMASGMKDPFQPLEAPICRVLFGSWQQESSPKAKKNGDKIKKN